MTDDQRPVTIVTGGSRGIGAASVAHLARAGHDIAVGYRDDQAAAIRVVSTATAEGVRCIAIRADVTREGDVQTLFATAAEQLGAVTGLVNSAGLTGHIGDLAETPVEIIRLVIDVNLLGAVLCARRAAQVMSGGAVVAAARSSTSPPVLPRSDLPTSTSTTRPRRLRSTRSRWAWPRSSPTTGSGSTR